jgi:uncharacterized membrane protein YhaH (DUF805 family)
MVDLFYLPVAIGLSRKARKAGWIMISFFLVKKLVFALVQITTEIVSPTEIYSHPDSFFPVSERERRVEIWLMILLPFLVWIVMLFGMWRPTVKHYFDISRSTGLKLLAYATAGTLLYRMLLFLLYDA